MKRIIVLTSAFVALATARFSYGSEELTASILKADPEVTQTDVLRGKHHGTTKHSNVPQLHTKKHSSSGIFSKLKQQIWPSHQHAVEAKEVDEVKGKSMIDVVANEVNKIVDIANPTGAIITDIEKNARSLGHRLFLGATLSACGYGIWRKANSINRLPWGQKIGTLLSQSANLKNLAWLAGFAVVTEVIAPRAISYWRHYTLKKTLDNHAAAVAKNVVTKDYRPQSFKDALLNKFGEDRHEPHRSIIERMFPPKKQAPTTTQK